MVLLGSDLVQQTPLHAAHVLYGLPQPKHGLSLASPDLLKKFRKVFPFPGTPKHLVNTESFTEERELFRAYFGGMLDAAKSTFEELVLRERLASPQACDKHPLLQILQPYCTP